MSVFGLKKCTLVRVFFVFRAMGVFTAFATLDAFLAAPSFGFSALAPFVFGAISARWLC